jgi:hypothetical protein
MVLTVKLSGVIIMSVATDTLLLLCVFLGLLFAFDDSLVFTAANVGVMTALKVFLELKNVIFNNAMLLCIFDSMSLCLGKKTCLQSSVLLGISKQ